MITHMTDDDGHDKTDRQTIADIFATFYGKLYASRLTLHSSALWDSNAEIQKFSNSELKAAIQGLKNGCARDGAGVFAELIKNGGTILMDVLLDLYNEVISVNGSPPTSWKSSMVTVLYKPG